MISCRRLLTAEFALKFGWVGPIPDRDAYILKPFTPTRLHAGH